MEVNQPRPRTNWRLCQTHNCSANASNTCLTDGVVVCNMCAAIFHYDCDVNIKDGEGFVIQTLETLKNFIETMRDCGIKTRIDRIKKDFIEEICLIQDQIKALEDEIEGKQIDSENLDYFVKNTKKLAKSIIESNSYSIYTDYLVKLEICGILPSRLDNSGGMGLQDIRTQLYLEAKKKERDLCEYKLKALAQEIDDRVSQAKQQLDQKLAEVESRFNQEADSTKSRFEKLEQLMFSKLEKMEQEQSLKLEEVNSKVDRQKKKARKSKKLNEEHKEQIKNNLEEHKQKIDHIENKQEKIKKEIDVTNKNTEERQTKQDEKADELNKKIDELAKESSESIKKLESSIEDTCHKIETYNEELKKDFELKIEAAESNLQKEQLQLRAEQFYTDTFGTNIASDFKEYFANSSGSYNKLGHFKYKSEDFSQPIQLKYSYPYVSVGQFKPATNILHGIGIRVDRFGFIDEGYWKNGKQDVNGRGIRSDGSYYIGTYKAGEFAKGTNYNKDGSIKQTYK